MAVARTAAGAGPWPEEDTITAPRCLAELHTGAAVDARPASTVDTAGGRAYLVRAGTPRPRVASQNDARGSHGGLDRQRDDG